MKWIKKLFDLQQFWLCDIRRLYINSIPVYKVNQV